MKPFLLLFIFACIGTCALAQSGRPAMSSHIPATGATNVATYLPLAINFTKPVTKGLGNIYVHNRSLHATLTIPVASPNVGISDTSVYITGVYLEAGSYFHVTFDSAAFDSADLHCYGLYDTSTWWFRTAGDGVGVPSIVNQGIQASLLNPSSGGLFLLQCQLPVAATLRARVYDLSGRQVASETYQAKTGDNQLRLQTTLGTGSYFIQLDDGVKRTVLRAEMR